MKKFRLALIAVLLIGLTVGVGLWYAIVLTPRSLKPEFNIFNLEAGGNLVKFNIQNLGEADAHNVVIKVNGSWCPSIEINVTSVEHGYSVTPEQIATVFNGTFDGSFEDMNTLARRIIPSVAGMERDSEHTWLKVMVVENGTWRYLTDSEVALLKEAFENPHPYYTFAEKTINALRKDEIKTVEIHLEWSCDSYEVIISCDEGVTLQEKCKIYEL